MDSCSGTLFKHNLHNNALDIDPKSKWDKKWLYNARVEQIFQSRNGIKKVN